MNIFVNDELIELPQETNLKVGQLKRRIYSIRPGVYDSVRPSQMRFQDEQGRELQAGDDVVANGKLWIPNIANEIVFPDGRGRILHGSYGTVIYAIYRGEEVAVKYFGYTSKKPDPKWILREINNLKHLKGISGIVDIVADFNDMGEMQRQVTLDDTTCQGRFPAIVMKRLSGSSLSDMIGKRVKQQESKVKIIFSHFISAVKAMHERNMIHCNLKPENLVFQNNEDLSSLTIGDFGIAVNLWDRPSHTDTKRSDRIDLLAPETKWFHDYFKQYFYSRKTDMWQVGCILYLLLSGDASPPRDAALYTTSTKGHIYDKTTEEAVASLQCSDEAKNLLKKLLTPVVDRIQAVDVLQDPWMPQ